MSMAAVVNEMNPTDFSRPALEVLRTAARFAVRTGAEMLDSHLLLYGLSHDASVWPSDPDIRRALEQLREQGAVVGSTSTEGRGEQHVPGGLPVSREVEAIVDAARERARNARGRRIDVGSEHLLWAVMDAPGNNASLAMRRLTGRVDPWPQVRRHLSSLERARESEPIPEAAVPPSGSRDERLVALLYLLLRDDVTVGAMEAHVQELESFKGTLRPINAPLEALARSFLERL